MTDSKAGPDASAREKTPVDLDLEKVLGKMPPKTFTFQPFQAVTQPLVLPQDGSASPSAALRRVMRSPDVCSKRFLTSKVDRSVTGLVAQQQCVGPLQLPLADYALVATSHCSNQGLLTAIGEQPYKGLVNPGSMARLALAECLTNLSTCAFTSIPDIRCSVNWMHAAKVWITRTHARAREPEPYLTHPPESLNLPYPPLPPNLPYPPSRTPEPPLSSLILPYPPSRTPERPLPSLTLPL